MNRTRFLIVLCFAMRITPDDAYTVLAQSSHSASSNAILKSQVKECVKSRVSF